MGPLQRAGVATVAYDAYGCGSSAKPRECAAYAPGELYADLEAVYERYGKARRRAAGPGAQLLQAGLAGTA